MKSLILALLAATLVSTNVNALGKREEGVLIGIGSAILINSARIKIRTFRDWIF